jgi:hypothetical protein
MAEGRIGSADADVTAASALPMLISHRGEHRFDQ